MKIAKTGTYFVTVSRNASLMHVSVTDKAFLEYVITSAQAGLCKLKQLMPKNNSLII